MPRRVSSFSSSASAAGLGLVGAMADKVTQKIEEMGRALGQGAAAVAVIGKTSLGAGAALAGSLGGMAQLVKLSNPGMFTQFTRAAQDFAAVMGQMVEPALFRMTELIRSLADYFINLTPETKKLLAALAVGSIAAAVGVGVVTLAVKALGLAIGVASGGIVPMIGLAITGITALAAGFGLVTGKAGMFSKIVEGAGEVLSQVWKPIKAVFMAVWEAIKPMFSGIGDMFSDLPGTLKPVIDFVKDYASQLIGFIKGMKPEIDAFGKVFGNVMGKVGDIAGSVLKTVGNAFLWLVRKIQETIVWLVKIGEAIGKTFAEGFSLERLGENLGNVPDQVAKKLKEIEEQRKKAREELDKPAPPKEVKSSRGAAVRESQILDFAAARQQFQLAALKASSGVRDPAEKQVEKLEKIAEEQKNTTAAVKKLEGRLARVNFGMGP